ncbi:MAG: hypothetical protein ABSE59_01270 [Opitutaceae bacterium]|jgi:hypothetical protein
MGDSSRHSASPIDPSRHPTYRLILVGAVFAICLVRLAEFVDANAVNLPFEDQWDSLTPLFKEQGPWACFFYQHGPPRLGLGGLVDWFLYRATGWNVCAEAWAEVIALGLATLAALALVTRLRGRLSWSDAGFPLLLLSPIHWESMTLTPFLAAMILPLLLTLLLAYAWSWADSTARTAAIGVLGSLDLFTGYGLCSAPVTIGLAVLLWLRPNEKDPKAERRQAGLILLCLAGAGLGFAHGYHWTAAVPGWRFPVPQVWDYPRFCALMFASLLGLRSISATTVVAGAVLLGLVLGAFLEATVKIWRHKATARARAVWALTGTSLVYAALTAIGRLPVNIQAAFMWRYMTLMTPALCGLAMAAEGWAEARSKIWGRCLMMAWVVLAAAIWCDFLPERYGDAVAEGKRKWIASYLATRDLHAANQEADCDVYFWDPDSPLVAERLRWLDRRNLSFFKDSVGRSEGRPASGPK